MWEAGKNKSTLFSSSFKIKEFVFTNSLVTPLKLALKILTLFIAVGQNTWAPLFHQITVGM